MTRFIDLGCKEGGSFHLAAHYFGLNESDGLGMDYNEKSVAKAREKGYNVVQGDVMKFDEILGLTDGVEYITASHILEHMKNEEDYFILLDKIMRYAIRGVLLATPCFDGDGKLREMGLRTYYSHWSDHNANVPLSELMTVIMERYRYTSLKLEMRTPIYDSSATEIHSLDSAIDQLHYDANIHPPKPLVKFDFPLYREFRLIITK